MRRLGYGSRVAAPALSPEQAAKAVARGLARVVAGLTPKARGVLLGALEDGFGEHDVSDARGRDAFADDLLRLGMGLRDGETRRDLGLSEDGAESLFVALDEAATAIRRFHGDVARPNPASGPAPVEGTGRMSASDADRAARDLVSSLSHGSWGALDPRAQAFMLDVLVKGFQKYDLDVPAQREEFGRRVFALGTEIIARGPRIARKYLARLQTALWDAGNVIRRPNAYRFR